MAREPCRALAKVALVGGGDGVDGGGGGGGACIYVVLATTVLALGYADLTSLSHYGVNLSECVVGLAVLLFRYLPSSLLVVVCAM